MTYTMNIACASSVKYLYPAKVMLYSLLINNDCEINIYLLSSELPDAAVQELECYVKKISPKCFLHPIKIEKTVFADLPISDHFSVETYYRILVLKVLPDCVDRAFFFDVDMVITGNIEGFYHQDFEDNVIVACADRTLSGNNAVFYKKLGFPENYTYINAGMLLYNIKEIRQRYSWDMIQSFIAENKDIIQWLDQDIINMLFHEKIKICKHAYNVQVPNIESREEETALRKNARIIHFCSYRKPWDASYAGIMGDIWWQYAVKAGFRLEHVHFKYKKTTAALRRRIYGAANAQTKKALVRFLKPVARMWRKKK